MCLILTTLRDFCNDSCLKLNLQKSRFICLEGLSVEKIDVHIVHSQPSKYERSTKST